MKAFKNIAYAVGMLAVTFVGSVTGTLQQLRQEINAAVVSAKVLKDMYEPGAASSLTQTKQERAKCTKLLKTAYDTANGMSHLYMDPHNPRTTTNAFKGVSENLAIAWKKSKDDDEPPYFVYTVVIKAQQAVEHLK